MDPAAPPLAVTAAAYKQRKVVYAAADEGDFAGAIAALPQLQTAIDAVIAVKDARRTRPARLSPPGVPATTPAARVATANVPTLTGAAKAFLAADKAVEDARKLPTGFAPTPRCRPCGRRRPSWCRTRRLSSTAAKPADAEAFDAKVKALEPRTGKSTETPVPPFVDALQKVVQGRLADIGNVMSANPKDLAAAESSYALMLKDLDAMEAGKGRYAAHRARFLAMKNGAIQASLAVALTPPALSTERAAAIAATEAAIVDLAGKGDTAGADAKLAAWALEAKGWQATQAAYAELHGGKVPSVDVLSSSPPSPAATGARRHDPKMSGTTPARCWARC